MAYENSDSQSPKKRYMVVERFKNPPAIYRRLSESGRMMPEGLHYVSSWIEESLEICFQLMETHDPRLLEEWMSEWSDLMDFEVHPVISSAEAAAKVAAAE
jgi:Protein of unknown function (DUF3303)